MVNVVRDSIMAEPKKSSISNKDFKVSEDSGHQHNVSFKM